MQISVLPNGRDLPLPSYASDGAAGMDLYAAIEAELALKPHRTAAVPTGIAIALPEGYEGQVRPRSGLAQKHGVGVINSPGTVDSDYRGEIMILLTNFTDEIYVISRGDRIAQLVVSPVARVIWTETSELPGTNRGNGGFGHTGR